MEHRIEGSLVPLYCLTISVCFVLCFLIGITAIILVTERSFEEVPDRTEGFSRSGGSGGGGGDPMHLPIPIAPVPNAVTGTAIPATSVKPDPHRLSSNTTHQPTPTVTPRALATTSQVTPSPRSPTPYIADATTTTTTRRPLPTTPTTRPPGITTRVTPSRTARSTIHRTTPSRPPISTRSTRSTPSAKSLTTTNKPTSIPTIRTSRPTTTRMTTRPTTTMTWRTTSRSTTRRATSRPTTLKPPTTVTRGVLTTRRPFEAAKPMPMYTFVCTVSEPVRNALRVPLPDGVCDFIFFDSLYKNGKNRLLGGLGALELSAQDFIGQARKSRSKFGFSFAPEPAFLQESKDPTFFVRIDAIWYYKIYHFGFLDLYREYAEGSMVTHALNSLKALYLHLKPRTTTTSSYYVVGLSMDNPASSQVLNLMKTVFAPSMFIAISHLSYPVRKFSDCRIFPVAMDALPPNLVRGRDYSYGHTVNESLAVLREVEKLSLSIPLAISFSLKGVYYVPRLAQPLLTQNHQYELFQPCQDHEMPYYEDPKGLCGKKNWAAPADLPLIASNLEEKRALTYLPDATIAILACDGKQFNLKLNFTLAAYDVDFDYNRPCTELGFDPFSSQFSRVKVAKVVSDFFRTNYTSTTMNSNCQSLALSFSFG